MAEVDIQAVSKEISDASVFADLTRILKSIFGIEGASTGKPDSYKSATSEYGLKVSGKKARERLNEAAREIIAQVDDPEDLTDEQREILLQYSGQGGLTENSQFEYYTPTHVAQGVWDAMAVNGFGGGNVIDPCTGAGVFSGTKKPGVIVSGNDLDPTSSKIAGLLNPEDNISNLPFERIAVDTPDNTFDGAIGNVPFGDARGKSAHIDKDHKSEKLIERYFVNRLLDKIRPGGLCCLVVPVNIVGATGKKWEEWRLGISRKAEFLGAHKLPSKTFRNQGTDTVVDVIVLKKHPADLLEKINDLNSKVLHETGVYFDQFISGKYWQGEGRKFIMGNYTPKVKGDRWSREIVDGDIDNEGLKQKLAQRFDSRIDWDALAIAAPIPVAYADGDRKTIDGSQYELIAGRWEKVEAHITESALSKSEYGASSLEELDNLLQSHEGCLSFTPEQLFTIHGVYESRMPEYLRAVVAQARYLKEDQRAQAIRGSIIGNMISIMKDKAQYDDVTPWRNRIQELITAEVERYGHPANGKIQLTGGEARFFSLFKTSLDKDGNFSDLLSGKIERKTGDFNAGDVDSIVSHLFVRAEEELITPQDVARLYSGERKIETLGDVAEFPGIAIDPVTSGIVPFDKYCTGDVYKKISQLQDAIAEADDERVRALFQSQIEGLLRRSNPVTIDRITFGMKHRWFDQKYLVSFLREQGFKNVKYGKLVFETYGDGDNSYTKEHFITPYDGPDGAFRGLSGRYEDELLKYLNGGNIGNQKKDSETHHEQTRILEEQFNTWMRNHADIDAILADYNRKFNGHIPQEYGDSDLGISEYLSGDITLHGYQNSEIRRLSEEGRGICGFGVGLGKAQPLDAKILTPSGWKLMGDMQVGDEVIAADGTVTTVTGVFPQGEKDIYEVVFHDGARTQCCDEHLWLTHTQGERDKSREMQKYKGGRNWNSGTPKVRELAEIRETLRTKKGGKNHSIQMVKPFDFEWQDVPLDPYLLGVLIGDGGFTGGSVMLTTPDDEIIKSVAALIPKPCRMVERHSSAPSKAKTFGLTVENGGNGRENPIVSSLKKLGLMGHKSVDKFVPDIYKFNNADVRLSILQGLMDTDGYVDKQGVTTQFSTSSERLADDVVFLAQSLGCNATVKSKMPHYRDADGNKIFCHEHFTVHIRFNKDIKPFRLSKKSDRVRQKEKYVPIRYFDDVTYIGKKQAQCISVAHSDSLYVTDDFIVTHNTKTTLGLAAYNLKKGRSHRTCVVVPKSVLEQWYHEARETYSESFMRSSVHVVGVQPIYKGKEVEREPVLNEKGEQVAIKGKKIFRDKIKVNLSATNKIDELWSIVQGNAKIVVIHRDLFETIPVLGDTVDAYSGAMVVSAMTAKRSKGSESKKRSYSDDKDQTRLEQKFSDTGTEKRDELPYFEEFDFDNVVVDEIHDYRNAFTPGRSANLLYLSKGSTAQRSLDMHVKTNYIRRKFGDRGVIGLSATPIVNSPFEIYSQLSLVCDKSDFERMGIYTADQFVDLFGKIETVEKMTLAGGIKTGPGIAGFKNLDALRSLFNKYVNIKNVKDVDDEIHVPEARRKTVEVFLSKEQQEAYAELRERAKKAADPYANPNEKEHVFTIIREMDRVTVDMDLYRRTISFVFPNKHKENVKKLEKTLPATLKTTVKDDEEGDETVTDSLSASYVWGESTFTFIVPQNYEDLVIAGLKKFDIPEEDVSHPKPPKYAAALEILKKEYENGGKVLVFTEEKAQHRKIKRLIVNTLAIPAGQVAIINATEVKNDDMAKISADYNTGKVRIVVANKKAEVGVNLQKGTTAILHLTLPLVPASFIQREGRGVRQGNENEAVDVYEFVAQGSLDKYRMEILRAKSNWLGELMTGKSSEARNENMEDASEILDMLADDPEEAKRIRAERLAKEREKREQRKKYDMTQMLQQLLNYSDRLENNDIVKSEEEDSLKDQISKANLAIAQAKERLELNPDNEPAKRKLAMAEGSLRDASTKLATIDVRYEEAFNALDSRIKQTKNYLRELGKKGELPFNASLVDSLECVTDRLGNVYSVGDTYEVHAENYRDELEFKGIAKVSAVYPKEKELEFEFIIGKHTFNYSSNRVGTKDLMKPSIRLRKCSYSERELAIKKIEATDKIPYTSIVKNGIDKALFAEIYDKIVGKIRDYSVIEKDGELSFKGLYGALEDGERVLFPDVESPEFKKRVLTRYLEYKRNGGSYLIGSLMVSLFGPNYDAIALEYGKIATAQEISEAVSLAYAEYEAKNYDPSKDKYEWIKSEKYTIKGEVFAAVKMIGDNHPEIKSSIEQYVAGKLEVLQKEYEEKQAEIKRLADEAERERLEKLKQDGVLTEIPADFVSKFENLGVKIWVNQHGFGGHDQYSKILFTDRKFKGPSYRAFAGNKENKNKWGATFNKTESAWVISSKSNIDELYSLLKDQ